MVPPETKLATWQFSSFISATALYRQFVRIYIDTIVTCHTPVVGRIDWYSNSWILPWIIIKTKNIHFADIFITGCTKSCKMTTSSPVSDGNFVKITTFSFQWWLWSDLFVTISVRVIATVSLFSSIYKLQNYILQLVKCLLKVFSSLVNQIYWNIFCNYGSNVNLVEPKNVLQWH